MELASKVPGWLKRILLPQLLELKGQVKAVDAKVGAIDARFDTKIGALDAKFESKFDAFEARFDARFNAMDAKTDAEFRTVHSEIKRLDERIDGLDKSMDITQRLVAAESKVRELEATR